MVGTGVREAIVGDRRITGLTPEVIAAIAAEIGPVWEQQRVDRLVSRPRSRTVGAGAKYRLVFMDRLLVTLVNLRHAVTHDVLACWFGVDRSTVTRAIAEIRPLLAMRGCSIAPGVRLRTLTEVVDHLGATGQTAIVDGTEIRVRRPAEGSPNRDRFVSGKTKQNAVKTMVITDAEGRVLFCSPAEPGSRADITHARQLGLPDLLAAQSDTTVLADAGYQGLGTESGGRVVTPPHRKFKKHPPAWYETLLAEKRHAHSSRRIRVEHGIAHLKNWRSLARHHGRREHMSDIIGAVAGLLSHQQTAAQPSGYSI
ncbi:transposase family protein [Glycomyces dulcitolivorans]|uniref:transposase family protein n=1 Tax=Glycomyces dulcitolivorans TaxID=2200759 RepID=UPI000DD4414B